MSPVYVLLLVVAAATPVLPASLPSYITTCKRNDPKLTECAIKNGRDALPKLINGDKELGIPVLDPFIIDEVVISERTDANGLHLGMKFRKLKVTGFKDVYLNDDSRFDLQNKRFEFRATVPSLQLQGLYSIHGKVLLLPVQGEGDVNMTLGDLTLTYITSFELHKGAKGKDYLQLVNPTLEFSAKRFKIHLDNLFNGDKLLGDNMNVFLNENGQEVLTEFGPVIKKTFSQLIFLIFNSVLKKIPFDQVFPQ